MENQKQYPEMIVNEELPVLVKALISAYESHIETLKSRIKELEAKAVPIIPAPVPFSSTPQRTVIRTSSQMIKALEELSAKEKQAKLDMNKEVRESDVK